jgi:hypothetical protein
VTDYKNDEINFQKSSPVPSITCPTNLPFTSTHDDCFTCTAPLNIFNLETKACQSCSNAEVFDNVKNKCFKKQYSTFFTNETENYIMVTDYLSLDQYKNDQAKIKSLTGSEVCPIDKPYATANGCLACNTTNPYFNIELNACIDCPGSKKFNTTQHKCLYTVYVTDFTNKNILLPINMTIAQAKASETVNLPAGTIPITCTSSTPYATVNGCVSCSNASLALFNF